MKTVESLSRKTSKPIMEKRRRARINESLSQLKSLLLDAMKKDSSRHSKLEKADILEMTVKYLRNLQRQQVMSSMSSDPDSVSKYRAGFNECMCEVQRYLSSCEQNVDTEVRARLLNHLANYCNNMPQASPVASPPVSAAAAAIGIQHPAAVLPHSAASVPIQHMQVSLPTTMSTATTSAASSRVGPAGNDAQPIAVIVPAHSTYSVGQLPSHFIPVYAPPSQSSPSAGASAPLGARAAPYSNVAIHSPQAAFTAPTPNSVSPGDTRFVFQEAPSIPVNKTESMWRPW